MAGQRSHGLVVHHSISTKEEPSSWQLSPDKLQHRLLLSRLQVCSQPLTAARDEQLASLGLEASRKPALAPAQDRSYGNPPRQRDSKHSSRAGPVAGRFSPNKPAAKPVLLQEELALGCQVSCICVTKRVGKHLRCMPGWWKLGCQQTNMPVRVPPCFEEVGST